jgi:hypothetical protein
MKAKLGDSVKFNYSAPDIHDKTPLIFFLAKVGHLMHGLNQHYQSPQEKYYYFLMLKNVLYQKIATGKIDAPTFYRLYVRNRLVSDSYRTYNVAYVSNVELDDKAWVFGQKVDIKKQRRGTYRNQTFKPGDKVKFVSMVKGKLSWRMGEIVRKLVPGANYQIKTDDGQLVPRHPSDLKPI